MKRLKKSTVLSLATAGVITVATVGTFAVWDKTTETKSATVTFDKPATVTMDDFTLTQTGRELGGADPSAEADITIKVADVPAGIDKTQYQIKIEPVVKDASGNVATDVTATVDTAEVGLDTVTDSGVTKKVTVNAGNTTAGGKTYTVDVTATLEKVSSPTP